MEITDKTEFKEVLIDEPFKITNKQFLMLFQILMASLKYEGLDLSFSLYDRKKLAEDILNS